MTTLYHNPRCSKSRQALEILEEAKEPVTIVFYLKDILSETALKKIVKLLGISAKDLVRKNEAIWKEHYTGKDLTEANIITAMHDHPKLIERPIAIKNERAIIGRPPKDVLKVL
ncbi:MAG: arsenate reductase [Planctomycetota bacterium]|jgi:arsenate reductase